MLSHSFIFIGLTKLRIGQRSDPRIGQKMWGSHQITRRNGKNFVFQQNSCDVDKNKQQIWE